MKTEDVHRWNMLQMAIENDERFIADRYEMDQEAWKIYTYDTMEYFKQLYPNDEVYFIMGADLLVDIGEGLWQKTSLL